jgi:hypothetical protein
MIDVTYQGFMQTVSRSFPDLDSAVQWLRQVGKDNSGGRVQVTVQDGAKLDSSKERVWRMKGEKVYRRGFPMPLKNGLILMGTHKDVCHGPIVNPVDIEIVD